MKPERDAYQVAINLLARREHSRVELHHKLTKKGFAEEQVDQALDQLQANGFQSDQRFIEAFVRSRILKGNGPLRIRQELRNRGIEQVDFQQLLEQAIDWLQVAMDAYQKKYGASEVDGLQEKAKRVRYMQSKGFPGDIIHKVIR